MSKEAIPTVESGKGQAGSDAGVTGGAAGSPPAGGVQQSFDPAADILRQENAQLRQELQSFKANTKKAEDERLAKQGEFEQLATQRSVEIEHLRGELLRERRDNALQKEAVRAGLKDMDFLRLVDPGSVIVAEDGTVSGAAEALRSLREKHEDLFVDPNRQGARTPSHTPATGAPRGFDPSRSYTSDEIVGMDAETFKAFRNRNKPAGDSKLGF